MTDRSWDHGSLPAEINDRQSLHRIAGTLARLGSDQLATVVTAGIEILDQRSGDPDMEDDDPDGQYTEDEISCGGQTYDWRAIASRGAGCEIGDPDAEHDGAEECAE